jgi:transposase
LSPAAIWLDDDRLIRSGAQGRLLPHKYSPRCTVFDHYAQWREDGTCEHVTKALRGSYRCTIGRAAQPTAAILDSQSVKATEMSGPRDTTVARRSRAASAIYSWIRKEIS